MPQARLHRGVGLRLARHSESSDCGEEQHGGLAFIDAKVNDKRVGIEKRDLAHVLRRQVRISRVRQCLQVLSIGRFPSSAGTPLEVLDLCATTTYRLQLGYPLFSRVHIRWNC
jgi:hypothetical protein